MKRHGNKFSIRRFEKRPGGTARTSLRRALRLITSLKRVECPNTSRSFSSITTVAAVHRFAESIAGRDYLIEVSAVSKDRWRACIVRRPGVPTALMPFYGTTPDEAARELSAWLTRAHERASTGR